MLSKISIRWKMTLAALAPLAVVLLLVSFGASYLINAWVVGEAQKTVRHDLNAAREVLRHEISQVQDKVRFFARNGLSEAVAGGELEAAARQIQLLRSREGLDFLSLTDSRGRALIRGGRPVAPSQPRAVPAFVDRVLLGEEFSGVALLDDRQLRREGEGLDGRARIDIRNAEGSEVGTVERRGMVIAGATPLRGEDGILLGCLYGGVLLNGNLPLVDRMKGIVFGAEAFQGREIGSATIFLDQTRVATTIRLDDGRRALGTRVSREVAEAVLQRRETWLDRAKVVEDWYLTAYEPLLDHRGKAIGALYVGLLEQPYRDLKSNATLILLGLLLLGGGLGFLLARWLSTRISRPILDLQNMAGRMAAGERGEPLPVESLDEVGQLTEAFNRMAGALQKREEEFQSLNWSLELKVAERTDQLEEKSLQLIRAQEELLRSEKLAAIGSLAAGVAHEINNPTAIIRGNVEILLMELASSGREEAEEIKKQTERISLITQNMLTFARQEAISPQPMELAPLLKEVMEQVGHQIPLTGVEVLLDIDPALPAIAGDAQRLRQVFTNLAVNGLQAMAGEGRLRISARPLGDQVEIAFADSGPGIAAEVRQKIFNPFFTTKSSGTGLGLSISYGIVKAHNGSIEVESEKGEGTIMRVRLPLRQISHAL